MSSNKFYSIIFTIILLYSCNSKSDEIKEGEFLLNVTITNLKDGTKILLKKQEENNTIVVDSTLAKNGKFSFKGAIETPSMYGIFIDSIQGGIYPLVESGTTSITAHKDSIFSPRITGSKLNEELDSFKLGSQKIVNKINDLFIQIQKARAENDLETINSINDKMRAINDENTQYTLNYAKNNPDSFVSSIVLQSVLRIPDVETKEIQNIYSNFSEEVKKSEYAKSVARFLQANQITKKDSIK